MKIGYIENTVGDNYVTFWFYRNLDGVWLKIKEETVPNQFRNGVLKRVGRSACLVDLSKR